MLASVSAISRVETLEFSELFQSTRRRIWLLDNLIGSTNQWQEADGKTRLFHFPALLSSNEHIAIGKQDTSQS
jgi:hypothetical protein